MAGLTVQVRSSRKQFEVGRIWSLSFEPMAIGFEEAVRGKQQWLNFTAIVIMVVLLTQLPLVLTYGPRSSLSFDPIASVCPKSPLFSKSRVFWQLDFRHLGSGWHDFQLALVGLAWFLVDVLAFNFRFRAIGAHFSLRLDAVACYCVPHAALESVLGGACACFSLSRPSKMLPKRCRLQDSTPSAA